MAFKRWLDSPANATFVVLLVPTAGFSVATAVVALVTSNLVIGLFAGVAGGFAGMVWGIFLVTDASDE